MEYIPGDYCIVLFLYIYITFLAVHTNPKHSAAISYINDYSSSGHI